MEEVFGRISPAKQRNIEEKIDVLLAKIDEDIRATKKTNAESDKLRKLIDKSHQQLRKTMERFESR